MAKVFIATLVLLTSISSAAPRISPQTTTKPKSVTLTPCDVPDIGKAQCGTYEVFEDRASQKGRKISLRIVVLPATGPNRAPDAIVYIAGGPGSSAVGDAPGLVELFAKLRESRDLVFIDQRGTGSSHPLNCKFYNPTNLQSYLEYFYPLEDVRKCREELEPKADLKLYTTPIAMDDLDEVRAALGYPQLNIFGGSYGTRAAMVYMRQHPKSVRTVTLLGVAPTNQFMPQDFALHMDRALNGVLAECAADQACNTVFPNLRAETKTVLAQLIRAPVEVEVRHPDSGEKVKVKLSRNLAAEAIRYMLYNPGQASRVPLFLHVAAEGNFAPLAEAALNYRRNLVGTGSNGLYLSITCAEDLAWIKPGEGERMAANTFLGDYRLQQQREACALWPRGTLPSNYSELIRSDAPVLILTGEWDPVTPPSNGEAVARHFPNSLHVIVPHGAHGFGGLEGVDCIERLNTEFVERGTIKGLDTACVKNVRRRGFALKLHFEKAKNN